MPPTNVDPGALAAALDLALDAIDGRDETIARLRDDAEGAFAANLALYARAARQSREITLLRVELTEERS